jgi:hypothetical protein
VINTPIDGDGIVTDSDRKRSTTFNISAQSALDWDLNERSTRPASLLS